MSSEFGSQPDAEEKPDPSEVESIAPEEYKYQRDEKGNLVSVQEVVKVGDEWRSVEHMPPVKGLHTRIDREFGGRSDVDFDKIDNLLSDFYTDPDIGRDDWDDYDGSFYTALMMHMVQVCREGLDDDTVGRLRDAIDERQSEGN